MNKKRAGHWRGDTDDISKVEKNDVSEYDSAASSGVDDSSVDNQSKRRQCVNQFKGSINIFGDIFTDIVARVPAKINLKGGDTLSKIDVFPGGSGSNVSCHLANYLQKNNQTQAITRIYSCVGDDTHGKLCIDYLDKCNVDTSYVKVSKSAKTGTCIVLSSGMERSFITDAGCIDNELQLDLFTLKEQDSLCCKQIHNNDDDNHVHFHMSGIFNISQIRKKSSDNGHTGIYNIFHKVKYNNNNVCTSLNPQYDALGQWDCIRDICPTLDILIANEVEVMNIANSSQGKELSARAKRSGQTESLDNVESLSEGAARILTWGCAVVVATLGSRGAVAFFRGSNIVSSDHDHTILTSSSSSSRKSRHKSSNSSNIIIYDENSDTTIWKLREVECVAKRLDSAIIDTTGAGDAFAAAFIGGMTSSRLAPKHSSSNNNKNNNNIPIPGTLIEMTESDIEFGMTQGCEAGGMSCMVVGGSTLT
jgi:sugar/nucleoside kinase (ribokinase family)